MVGTRHIQIDARHVSEVTAVLMSLTKEMAAVIVVRCRTTRIMIQNEISVFIRLSVSAIAQMSELRDYTGWIFEQINAFYDQRRSKFRRIDIVGDRHWIGCGHTGHSFIENPQLVGGSLGGSHRSEGNRGDYEQAGLCL